MKCNNCGSFVSEDVMFCPICKSRLQPKVPWEEKADFQEISLKSESLYEDPALTEENTLEGVKDREYSYPNYENYYNEPGMYDGTPKEKENTSPLKKNLGLIIAASSLFVLIVILFVLAFFTDTFTGVFNADTSSKEDKSLLCSICDKEIDDGEEYCTDCTKKYSCDYCENVSLQTEDGFCENCAIEYRCTSCDKVDKSVKEGYCEECADKEECKAEGCKNRVSKGYYCNECIEAFFGKDEDIICSYCDKKIKAREVFVIDTYGSPYCDECDTKKYCTICGGYVEKDESGDKCVYCSQIQCLFCNKGITDVSEAIKDTSGYYYCSDCDTGYYCKKCKAPVSEGKEYCFKCTE